MHYIISFTMEHSVARDIDKFLFDLCSIIFNLDSFLEYDFSISKLLSVEASQQLLQKYPEKF